MQRLLNRQLLFRHSTQLRSFSSANKENELVKKPMSQPIRRSVYNPDKEDDPVAYSTSKASDYKAIDTYINVDHDAPPSQTWVVTISTFIFLAYFVLREENDIDKKLYDPWSGSEKIYKSILEVHLKKNTGSTSTEQLKKKISELEEKIAKTST